MYYTANGKRKFLISSRRSLNKQTLDGLTTLKDRVCSPVPQVDVTYSHTIKSLSAPLPFFLVEGGGPPNYSVGDLGRVNNILRKNYSSLGIRGTGCGNELDSAPHFNLDPDLRPGYNLTFIYGEGTVEIFINKATFPD